jgi:hypothetical protein
MKPVRSRLCLLAALTAPGLVLLSSSLAGCGGSETPGSSPEDAATEGGSSGASGSSSGSSGSSSGSSSGTSSGSSSGTTSSGSSGSSSGSSSGTSSGSSSGAGAEDASSDAGIDSTIGVNDAGSDATSGEEAGSAEAGEAGGGGTSCAVTLPTEANFYSALAAERCTSIGSCCTPTYGTGTVYNDTACLGIYANPSGWLGVLTATNYIGGGRVAYNTSNACACLVENQSLACGTIQGTAPDAGLIPLVYLCNEAIEGTSGIGGACASSYECAPGEYCSVELAADPASSSSLGTCATLIAQGGACTADTQCSYLALGQPSLYCDTVTTNECQPRVAAGQVCSDDNDCISGLCSGNSCLIGQAVSSSFICSYLAEAADAGM